ncbi:MAG: hypothetical protein PVJ67_05185 [Candidatus Pacearchaeota archaeon]|jgi:hypothetical protein
MDIKEIKVRKNIVLNQKINNKLIELSTKTRYSQSEIIEMALKKLDKIFDDDIDSKIRKITSKARISEKELTTLVLKKIVGK